LSLNEAQQYMIMIPIPPNVKGSSHFMAGKYLHGSRINTSV
jgi:hypothetical protein